MTTRILAVALSALLSGNCLGQAPSSNHPSPQEPVRAIGAHTPVEVRFNDGSKLRGWVGEVSDTGFVVSHQVRRQLANSQVTLNQIRAVKQVHCVKPGNTARNIPIGLGIGLAAIGAIFGIGLATHGPG
jgi:hypothetical protein